MDFVALIEEYCTLHKDILHDAINDIRLFTDPDQFNPSTHKYPCVLLIELPKRARDNKSDNIFLLQEYELWFLKSVRQNDAALGKLAQDEMLGLAQDFVSRLKKQSSFAWQPEDARIKFFHVEDCVFEKISNLGLMGDFNWGATLRITLGDTQQFGFDAAKWN